VFAVHINTTCAHGDATFCQITLTSFYCCCLRHPVFSYRTSANAVICWHKLAVKATFSFSCCQAAYKGISWGTGRVFTTWKRSTSRMSWRLVVPFIALTCAATTWKLHSLHRDLAPIGLADGRLSGGLITQSRRFHRPRVGIQLRGLIERRHLVFGHNTNFRAGPDSPPGVWARGVWAH